ncbi:cupin domain-containing protein [Specibacter cremeus]|uniref:cupin domain-containing protein n=1 Tax=Specibacter cremeus TaxID=1629051 RepID=UPI000F776F65|nr:cupin domain-containing protein [Specibacter cremeus]
MEKSSLTALARELLAAAATSGNGRAARTVVGGHERILRHTVIALTAGSMLDEHDNPGEATAHVLAGRIVLAVGDVSWEGSRGDLIVIPQARHSVTAVEDSAFLLTVAKGR